jgi:hypothetical protein
MNLHDCFAKSAHLLKHPSLAMDSLVMQPMAELFYRESNKWPVIFRLTIDNGRNSRQNRSGCVKKQKPSDDRGKK